MVEKKESEENLENQTVKVRDRRRFDSSGELREEEAGEESFSGPARSPEGHSQRKEGPSEKKESPAEKEEDFVADFATLLLSLASSAQIGLGLSPNPGNGKLDKNLPQAKHAIDLLGILQEKTKGNLTREEGKLLEVLLYDLRVQYLEVKKETGDEIR